MVVALGPLLLFLSAELAEPWRLIVFVLGCVVAGIGVLSMLMFGLMGLISTGVRYPKAVAPLIVTVILLVSLLAFYLSTNW